MEYGRMFSFRPGNMKVDDDRARYGDGVVQVQVSRHDDHPEIAKAAAKNVGVAP